MALNSLLRACLSLKLPLSCHVEPARDGQVESVFLMRDLNAVKFRK